MKIALAQLNYHIGNFEGNYQVIQAAVQEAKANNADLIVFAELAVCGYPPRDLLKYGAFVEHCLDTIDKVAKLADDIAIIIGGPAKNDQKHQKKLFNAAYFLKDQKVARIVRKTLLPSYDIFDEDRYFEKNSTFQLVELKNRKIALTICEDIWNMDDYAMYHQTPMKELVKEEPDFMINISASPFDYEHPAVRQKILTKNVKHYNLPLIYVNQVGAQTDILFDGQSQTLDRTGQVQQMLPAFQQQIAYTSINKQGKLDAPEKKMTNRQDRFKLIHDGLITGIRDYFKKSGLEKAVLGLSGGIDSAVSTVLASRALGKDNVHALMMPSKFSSDSSVSDAKVLCKKLDISHDILDIQEVVDQNTKTLAPFFKDTSFGITEENIQARVRAVLLMAFSNKFGYLLLNSSNKSEIAVGYGTLYGDLSGAFSVLGDVYKTQVYKLADFINRDKKIIPENILAKPPSAELRPGQKDTDTLPPYEVLDDILYRYIEGQESVTQIQQQGFDKKVVKEVVKMVNQNEHKRKQTGPVLRISPKAFGQGRRMPIVAKYDF